MSLRVTWITATITEHDDTYVVTEPHPYPTIDADQITATIDPGEPQCDAPSPTPNIACPLIAGHPGPHWLGYAGLTDELGGPVRLWATTYEAEP